MLAQGTALYESVQDFTEGSVCSGVHVQPRNIMQIPPYRNSPVIHPPPRPPPTHMSCRPPGATWVHQPCAAPVLSNACARPPSIAPQGSTGVQVLQCQGPRMNQQMRMGHRPRLDQQVHVAPQPMQHIGTLPVHNQQCRQPSVQGDMPHGLANHQLVYTDMTPGQLRDPCAGVQALQYSPTQTAQILPGQGAYHPQSSQYASSSSHLQTQVLQSGHFVGHIQPVAVRFISASPCMLHLSTP